MFCDLASMRIDTTSLIAAQSVQRPTQAAPQAPQAHQVADKPLFEALIFTQTRAETAPSRAQGPAPATPVRRPGSQLDITV